MKINVIIVDDERRAHTILENYIGRMPELQLCGAFTNAVAAREFILQSSVDVMFLDITMPEVSGFDLLKLLKEPPLVIFTTAHPGFAFESYEYDAVDYLKKPIPFDRFVRAVNKAVALIPPKKPETLQQQIELKIDGEMCAVPFSIIHYFQSFGNYIKVITDQKQLIVQLTTAELESSLPRERFIRIHKSFIVNRAKIRYVADDEIVLGDCRLPIGKTFKKYVREILAP
jgi:DNA-binding LytR/AlgR family response regulator